MTWQEIKKIHTWLPETSENWHQHENGGGWVENSTHVAFSARVYSKALVYGEALVCGEAQVYGEAQVCGKAQVYGEISKTPPQVIFLPFCVCQCSKNEVAVGCQHGTLDWWLANGRTVATQYNISESDMLIYEKLIRFCFDLMKEEEVSA